MEEIIIRSAKASELRDLRHRVLRAGMPIEEADFPGDEATDTFHAAAVTLDGKVVGCATLMMSKYGDGPAWRLRGMAVDPEWRKQCIGKRLLDLCEAHVRHSETLQLWCNARTPAVPFYLSLDWTRHGSEFDIPTAGPHYIMSKLLQNR
ncbi:MAG: GNAT family N-acetyltransferase [Phycisphaerae bacterium]|nr:GNAT family N-acetyltransferase [Phycisphaerae bacterium]